jgi:hypothetical protein
VRIAFWAAAAAVMFVVFTVAAFGQSSMAPPPLIPPEVKVAALIALRNSDTDGMHEEGFIWGKDAAGNVLIVMSATRPCRTGKCEITFEAADPGTLSRLTSVDGFAHIHPRGDGRHIWVQSPSVEDMMFAADSPGACNIVIGAADHKVYFFDGTSVTKTVKLKEFLQ